MPKNQNQQQLLSILRNFIVVTGNLEITSLRKNRTIIFKVNIFDEKE
jgi:hypothetical protein